MKVCDSLMLLMMKILVLMTLMACSVRSQSWYYRNQQHPSDTVPYNQQQQQQQQVQPRSSVGKNQDEKISPEPQQQVVGGRKLANIRALLRILQTLRGESASSLLFRQLLTQEYPEHVTEYTGDNADDDELRRLNRNYYGWMDFGKRSVSEDDFNY